MIRPSTTSSRIRNSKGKALGLPLWKLLGGGRDRIRTYASGALRRGLKLEEAVTAAGRLRDKGYKQAKMQLGLPGMTTPAREVEQSKLIREAVGPDMDLMCDINQRWRPEQAIDIGKRVQDALTLPPLRGGPLPLPQCGRGALFAYLRLANTSFAIWAAVMAAGQPA